MDTLHDLLSTNGLSRVSKEITNVAQSSIRLKAYAADETGFKLGTTKFGGLPDLPRGKRWPEYHSSPLPFLAQINLSDVVSYDNDHLLPETGILYFFFDIEAFLDWPDDQVETWHVWYTQSSDVAELQPNVILEMLSKPMGYHLSGVNYSTEVTLPDYSSYDPASVERLGLKDPLTAEEEQAYYKIQAQLAGTAGTKYHVPMHRLSGYPDPVQWDMLSDLGGSIADWCLLFQMDSDSIPDTDWGDTGRIYFWIRMDELQRCDFSRVRLILQS